MIADFKKSFGSVGVNVRKVQRPLPTDLTAP